MFKNLLRVFAFIIIILILFISYLSIFGIKTNKFNEIIKSQIIKQDSRIKIDLDNVYVKLNIKEEQDKIETMIDKISTAQPKKHKKYKNITLQDLSVMFQEEENINKKLKIYEHICYIIELHKNQLFEEV